MKTSIFTLTLATLLLAGASAHAVSETGTAKATIIPAIQITPDGDLDFAGILPKGTAGNLTINPQTSALVTGHGFTTTGTAAAGKFVVAAQKGVAVQLSVDTGSITLKNAANDEMTLSALTTYPAAGSVTMPGTGSLDVFVGGTLAVGAAQAVGDYSGTYTITVTY